MCLNRYQTHPERFPATVREVMLRAGEIVHNEYEIIAPLYLSGTELCYHAQQTGTGISCLLFELLPLRWCSADPSGRFVPYHEEAETIWTSLRSEALSRLAALQQFAQETAVPAIKDGFEENGTIWYVTRFAEAPSLADEKQLYPPKEAVSLLAPLLDTLSGMHQKGICHGAITAASVHLHSGECELRDWLNFALLAKPEPIDDVRAVSLILWQMMTGEPDYSEDAGDKLPASVRIALHNGLFDDTMTVSKLWKQLHAKKPAKRFQTIIMQPQHRSVLAKIFNPVVTAAFCACCLAAPFLAWRLQTGALVNQTAAQELDDVAYSLASDEVQVPELLYLNADDAAKQLEALGLNVLLTAPQDNPVIPENQVIIQNPTAGAVLKTGDTVTLTISGGWANFVPDVCGLTRSQAEQKLTISDLLSRWQKKSALMTRRERLSRRVSRRIPCWNVTAPSN